MSALKIIFIGTSGSPREAVVQEEQCTLLDSTVKVRAILAHIRAIELTGLNSFFTTRGKLCIILNSYTFHYFLHWLMRSRDLQSAWLHNSSKFGHKEIFAYEILPQNFYLDQAWGRRLEYLARERAEVEHAFSWLSTLGGAFSALGDNFNHCAVMAGRISWAQLRLAARLGDPIMKSRCYLFLAISLAQQGELRKAKNIVRLVRKSQPCLKSICQGVKAHFFRLKKTQRGS